MSLTLRSLLALTSILVFQPGLHAQASGVQLLPARALARIPVWAPMPGAGVSELTVRIEGPHPDVAANPGEEAASRFTLTAVRSASTTYPRERAPRVGAGDLVVIAVGPRGAVWWQHLADPRLVRLPETGQKTSVAVARRAATFAVLVPEGSALTELRFYAPAGADAELLMPLGNLVVTQAQ